MAEHESVDLDKLEHGLDCLEQRVSPPPAHLPEFQYKTILHIFHHLKSNIYLWEFKRKKKQEDKKNMQELESQLECTLASTVNSLLRDTLISQRLYLQTFLKYLSMVKKEFLDN